MAEESSPAVQVARPRRPKKEGRSVGPEPWLLALDRAQRGPWARLSDGGEKAAARASGLARAAGWLSGAGAGSRPGGARPGVLPSCGTEGVLPSRSAQEWVLPSQRGLDRALPWLRELDPATARDYLRRTREALDCVGLADAISWPKLGGTSRRRGRALDHVELGRLLGAFTDPAATSLAAWLVLTGARPGEARATRWRDLERTGADTGLWRVRGTKTAAARRVLPLDSAQLGVLPSWGRPDDLVWPISDWAWRQAWDAAVESSGLAGPDLVPYILRHTFCTRALERGLTYEQVAAWLGHANGDTLRRHYRHAVAPVAGVGLLLTKASS